jgi:trehalose 6-phosphate phosphatase
MMDSVTVKSHEAATNASTPPPAIESDWALFLDFDGTLLDLAPTPSAVVVPDGLREVLSRLRGRLQGALAIVTGRPIEEIDALLAPLILPVAGNHGASARLGDGAPRLLAPVAALPADWVARARAACAGWPGTIVEPKPFSLAVHFRQAPAHGPDVWHLLSDLAADHAADYEVLTAHAAFELRSRHASKALAIERLMALPPFQGRVPVFIGDDVTDESGRAAARRLGGIGLDVAASFAGSAARVRAWLAASVVQGS